MPVPFPLPILLPVYPWPQTPEPPTTESGGTTATLQEAPRDSKTGAVVVIPPSQAMGAPPSLKRPETTTTDDAFVFPEDERGKVYIEATRDFHSEPGNTDLFIAEGDVDIRYNGYRVHCDRATIDRKTRIATFEGNAQLITARQTVFADYVALNMDNRDFTAHNAHTIVPADMAGGDLQEPLYLSGETITRTGQVITAENGNLTTCDFPLPHFRFQFKSARIIPNDRIVLRKTSFYRYNSRVFQLDYLSIPIRDAIKYSFVPQVGHTQEEGYFVKSALGYTLANQFPGIFRLDLMEKKGIGIGTDQAYRFGETAAGTLILYGLRDQGRGVTNTNGRLSHVQRFGEVDVSIASDFQNNSYYAATENSKTQNTTITATRNIGVSNTNVTYNFTNNSLTSSESNSDSYTLTQDQRFGRDFRVKLRLNGSDQTSSYTVSDVTSSSTRKELVGDLSASGKMGIFDLDFASNKSLESQLTNSSGTSNIFSGTEKLPELTLRTTADRLGGSLRGVPLNFSLGLGRYVENPGQTTTSRALIDIDGSRIYPLAPRSATTLTINGGFRQYLYEGNDAAQYVLESSPQLSQKVGRDGTFNLNYSYLRPYGGTPIGFRLDSVGSNNNLGSSFSVTSYRTKLSLLTGYDIQRAQQDLGTGVARNPWQNLATQLAFRPSPVLQTRFTTTYNLNTNTLVDATNRIRIRAPGGFALDTGLRFDPMTGKFPQMTGSLQSPLFGDKANMSAYVSYNEVTKQFDYKSFSVTRVLHDYEITMSYIDQPYGFRTEQGISFTIRLKAFPGVLQSNTGQYGTALDTGTGEVF